MPAGASASEPWFPGLRGGDHNTHLRGHRVEPRSCNRKPFMWCWAQRRCWRIRIRSCASHTLLISQGPVAGASSRKHPWHVQRLPSRLTVLGVRRLTPHRLVLGTDSSLWTVPLSPDTQKILQEQGPPRPLLQPCPQYGARTQ